MLEDRLAPATFTVNVATDAGNNANPDAGSLRAAILSIDAGKDINAGTVATVGAYGVNDTIIFKIGTGTKTIAVTDDLPAITKPVAIDGSQGPAGQKIVLKPAMAGSNGLHFQAGAGGSLVGGFTITGFIDGIFVDNVDHVMIGYGPSPAAGQAPVTGNPMVIINSLGSGIDIKGSSARDNRVVSSFIGIDPTTGKPFPNDRGITIENGATYNLIGDGTVTGRNVISGNTGDGIFIVNNANQNDVNGNYIGTKKDGSVRAVGDTTNYGNGGVGVEIKDSNNNRVGIQALVVSAGVITAPANVISGNGGNGVTIAGYLTAPTGNSVLGNFIGADANGTSAISNGGYGVYLGGAETNTIGDAGAALGNVISGNTKDGVYVENKVVDTMGTTLLLLCRGPDRA